MKAVVSTEYGGPEVARLVEIDKPIPKENEVLIKVHASTVNRTDCAFRSAEYAINRLFSGLLKPKNKVLGNEFAGVIEEIGVEVSSFNVGDKVFGYNDRSFGAHAEYLCLKENKAIGLMPTNFSFEEAASLCEGGHYALSDIRAMKLQAGQTVLIYGATGAIGSAALQLLKHMGLNVTAVCDTKNATLVKSLGADVVVDYTKQDFTQLEKRFDVIYDAVGKSSFSTCKHLLTKKGIYKSTELGKNSENIFLALFTPLFGGKKVIFPIPSINKKDVHYFKELAENKAYKPVIDRIYTLDKIVEAYHYVESGQKTGNVVLTIA